MRRSAWGLGWIAYSSKLSLPTACARLSQAPEGAGLREWLEGLFHLRLISSSGSQAATCSHSLSLDIYICLNITNVDS